jgi:hypothetical protein
MILAISVFVLLVYFAIWFFFYLQVDEGDKQVNVNAYILAGIALGLAVVFSGIHVLWLIWMFTRCYCGK